MQNERVGVREWVDPYDGSEMLPRPIRSNSHKVSGAVGATCRHSNVRLAIPSREVLGKYLNISSIVWPPVPRRLRSVSLRATQAV